MKRTLAILLAALMLCAFSACGSEGENASGGSASGGAGEQLGKYDFYDYDLNEYVEPGEFKGIEISAAEVAATDDEVLQKVYEYLDGKITVEKKPVTDRPVQKGDFVNIDFQGLRDGVPFEGGTAQGYDGLQIGAGQFIPGFEEGLIGVEIGQTVALDLNFPDPYPNNPDLAGVPVVFNVKVNSIQAYEYPEITDELVAEHAPEYGGAAEFLAHFKAACEDEKKNAAVCEKVLDGAKVIKYPQKELDEFKAQVTRNYQNYADAYGVTLEQFLQQYVGVTYDTFNAQVDELARDQIKERMVWVAIARREGIVVTEEEFNAYLDFSVQTYNYASAEECLNKLGREAIELGALIEKTEKAAVSAAVVK